jgi:AraC-like DNA-binding protein
VAYHDDIVFVDAGHLPRCRVEVDRRFPGTWSLEFIGGGRMRQAVDGGPEVVIDRPAAFWHLPEHRYRYGPVDPSGWDHHWVLLRGDRARRMVAEGLAPLAASGWVPVADAVRFGAILRDLIQLVQVADPRRQPRAVALLEDLVAQLVEQPDLIAAGPHHAAVLRLAEGLRADPWRAWDPAVAAGRLGLSVSSFRRIFRQAVGTSPHAYLVGCRMRQAADLLRRDGRPVQAVAAELGFADPLRFSKVFRRCVGLSPRTYRRACP